MTNEFIESIESNLNLYRRKEMSAELLIDWLKVDLKKFEKQKERLSERGTTVFCTDRESATSYAPTKAD